MSHVRAVTSDVEVPAPLVNLTSDPVCVGVGALVYLTLAWMPSVGGYVQWVPKLVPVNIKVAPVKNSCTSKQKLYQ